MSQKSLLNKRNKAHVGAGIGKKQKTL